jgi:hypothetical protein
MRASRVGGLLLGTLVLALVWAASAQAARSPLEGNGMWIWYVSQSGGSAGAIANKAHDHNIDVVLIKSSDGQSAWSQFTRDLVKGLHQRGIKVCAWQFVYGDHPREEAMRGVEAVRKGADCLVIDAESHYEGRYVAADRYIRTLRPKVGADYPVGLTTFPWVDYHPGLPYSVFLGRGGATLNLPQVYWRAIGASVDSTMGHTYRWNLPYDRAIYPLGQTYQNPPGSEIRRFRRLAAGYESKGVSWWSWQETTGSEWNRVGERLSAPYPDKPREYPRLARGARSDVVVLLQELLLDAGQHLGVDGTFGSGTAHDLRAFQGDHGLDRTGVTDKPTWKALRAYRATRIKWSRRGNPDHVKATSLRPQLAPALELPSTPGRP